MVPNRPSRPDAARKFRRQWHPYKHHDDGVVTRELIAVLQAPNDQGRGPTQSEIQMRLAEFRALIRDAEDGELTDGRWTSVSRDPLLWELRWRWAGTRVNVRIYFHEPDQPFDRTVVSKVHVKEIIYGCDELIKAKQNAQIDEASSRIALGRPDLWGLLGSEPLCPRK